MTRRRRSRLRRWLKREARRLRNLYASVGYRLDTKRESLLRALRRLDGTIARFPLELPARERRARAAKHGEELLHWLATGEGNWIGSEYDR